MLYISGRRFPAAGSSYSEKLAGDGAVCEFRRYGLCVSPGTTDAKREPVERTLKPPRPNSAQLETDTSAPIRRYEAASAIACSRSRFTGSAPDVGYGLLVVSYPLPGGGRPALMSTPRFLVCAVTRPWNTLSRLQPGFRAYKHIHIFEIGHIPRRAAVLLKSSEGPQTPFPCPAEKTFL